MRGMLVKVCVALALCLAAVARVDDDDSNPLLSLADVAGRHGYKAETHHLTTDDGFILEAFRLPHKGPEPSKGVVVFLSGWLCQVMYFVVNTTPEGSIPYQMVEQGYTVWMMQHRNKPYPSHIQYKETDPEMWNYTNKDMIYTDIPAALNYIKDQEGGQKATLIGHSRGGFFTGLFAADPRSKDLLNAAVLIGGTSPEVNPSFSEMVSPFGELLSNGPTTGPSTGMVEAGDEIFCRPCGPKDNHWPGCCGGIGPLKVPDPRVHPEDATGGQAADICRDVAKLTGAARNLCTGFIHELTGGNATEDPARMPMMFAFYPSYESQFTQNVAEIPFLNVSEITVPVVVFEGEHDKFVPPEVAKLVVAELRRHDKLLDFTILEGYGHVDEIAAVDCGTRIGGHLATLLPQL